MINKIRPKFNITSAPALREYSRNYNNLWRKLNFGKSNGILNGE